LTLNIFLRPVRPDIPCLIIVANQAACAPGN
jgi:hypothetical protein